MSEFHAPPDVCREEVWLRRKGASKNRRRRESVTDEDLDELKACIELGFGFDSPEVDRRLSDTLPALHLFYAVNNHYSESTPSPLGCPHSIFITGENPQAMKARLRQWAQVVACSVRQCSFPGYLIWVECKPNQSHQCNQTSSSNL